MVLQVELRSLYAVYGSFGDVFEDDADAREERIAHAVKEIATKTSTRAQKELKYLPFRT